MAYVLAYTRKGRREMGVVTREFLLVINYARKG